MYQKSFGLLLFAILALVEGQYFRSSSRVCRRLRPTNAIQLYYEVPEGESCEDHLPSSSTDLKTEPLADKCTAEKITVCMNKYPFVSDLIRKQQKEAEKDQNEVETSSSLEEEGEQIGDQTVEQVEGQVEEQLGEQPAEEQVGKQPAEEQVGEQPAGGQVEKKIEHVEEQVGEQPAEEQVGEQSAEEQVGEQPAGGQVEKKIEHVEEQVGEQPAEELVGEQPAEEQVGEQPAGGQVEEKIAGEEVEEQLDVNAIEQKLSRRKRDAETLPLDLSKVDISIFTFKYECYYCPESQE